MNSNELPEMTQSHISEWHDPPEMMQTNAISSNMMPEMTESIQLVTVVHLEQRGVTQVSGINIP